MDVSCFQVPNFYFFFLAAVFFFKGRCDFSLFKGAVVIFMDFEKANQPSNTFLRRPILGNPFRYIIKLMSLQKKRYFMSLCFLAFSVKVLSS